MEAVLSEFVSRTGADAELARDILQGQKWDLDEALKCYRRLNESFHPASESRVVECNGCIMPAKVKQALYTTPAKVHADPIAESKVSTTCSSRPILHKGNAVNVQDERITKKLSRGISKASENHPIVDQARNEVQQDFSNETSGNKSKVFFVETPVYTFSLPDMSIHPDDFRSFLEKDLIETSTLVSLENAGRLNWWAEVGPCRKLWPLATSGDGNCLLHAASLGMWGFHDRLLTLRKTLHATLTNGPFREAFWRRWRWQQTLQNKQAEFVYSETEWEKEWENVLRLSSTEPRPCPGRKLGHVDAPAAGMLDVVQEEETEHHVYESLEEIHVLALAHVLRRPIIVVADTMLKAVTGEPLAPIPFGGIYLPLEISPSQCHRSPLVLTYDAAHFSALVAMESEAENSPASSAVIPLVDPDLKLLTIQFDVDPGLDFHWGRDEFNDSIAKKLVLTERDKLGLLGEYLDIVNFVIFNHPKGSSSPVNGNHTDTGRNSIGSDDGAGHMMEMKGRTSKQFNSVAKQFGSLGRSVSKKIKKNLGNLTKTVSRSGSFKSRNVVDVYQNDSVNGLYETGKTGHYHVNDLTIVAALLHTNRRHGYQEEMIKNYLSSAKERFLNEKKKNAPLGERQHRRLSSGLGIQSGPIRCINPGCDLYGTVATSYLCSSCFQKQKHKESELKIPDSKDDTTPVADSLTLIGSSSPTTKKPRDTNEQGQGMVSSAGRSKFYTSLEPGKSLVETVEKIAPGTASEDPTVYLSNSVFFNDCEKLRLTSEAPVDELDNNFGDVKLTNDNISRIYVNGKPLAGGVNKPCRMENCSFFANSSTDYYCSQCYKQKKSAALGSY